MESPLGQASPHYENEQSLSFEHLSPIQPRNKPASRSASTMAPILVTFRMVDGFLGRYCTLSIFVHDRCCCDLFSLLSVKLVTWLHSNLHSPSPSLVEKLLDFHGDTTRMEKYYNRDINTIRADEYPSILG
jgi:hypothetical protein